MFSKTQKIINQIRSDLFESSVQVKSHTEGNYCTKSQTCFLCDLQKHAVSCSHPFDLSYLTSISKSESLGVLSTCPD